MRLPDLRPVIVAYRLGERALTEMHTEQETFAVGCDETRVLRLEGSRPILSYREMSAC